ncbi:MAG: hypothetical protein ACK4TL_05610 [Hyphomicrobiaceae bacterium]
MADPARGGVPPLVRLILVNALVGVLAGAVVAAALVSSEGLGLGRLLAASGEPWLAAGLFFSGMMGTFGSLAAGAAIMLDDPSRRRG